MLRCSIGLPGTVLGGLVPVPVFQKILPQIRVPNPMNCGGLNGTGSRLFRNLEVHCKARAALDLKIAHDLAATHPEVVTDPSRDPGMLLCKCSGEFNLIANVLPLFRHISAPVGISSNRGLCSEASPTMPSPQARLVGGRAIVKENGDLWRVQIPINSEGYRWGQRDGVFEQIDAQIMRKAGEAGRFRQRRWMRVRSIGNSWSIDLSSCTYWVPFDFQWTHF